jgi:RNA-directed DNA polymerase
MSQSDDYLRFLELINLPFALRESVPSILADSTKFYRSFSIPKRSGGVRNLCSPYPSLREIQRHILNGLLNRLPIHGCAIAYRTGYSARSHAALHAENSELLILDLKDFFQSISRQMVYQKLVTAGLNSGVSHYTAILCCLNGSLPQGACTSPVLSNLIFTDLDERLHRLARTQNMIYSRYADDLAFSGARVSRSILGVVEDIVASKGFRLNEKKTKLKIAGAKKIITGVSISSGALKVPKKFKRRLRAEIYELERNLENLAGAPSLDPFVFERVLGRINYLLHIEPDCEYAKQKKEKLSAFHQKMMSMALTYDPAFSVGKNFSQA